MTNITNQVLFDVEMIDYDEMSDATTIRVSTTEGNIEIATGQITYDEGGQAHVIWTKVREEEGYAIMDRNQLTVDVLDAIQCERESFVDAETLRDLFSDVTPSGVTTPAAAGFKLL